MSAKADLRAIILDDIRRESRLFHKGASLEGRPKLYLRTFHCARSRFPLHPPNTVHNQSGEPPTRPRSTTPPAAAKRPRHTPHATRPTNYPRAHLRQMPTCTCAKACRGRDGEASYRPNTPTIAEGNQLDAPTNPTAIVLLPSGIFPRDISAASLPLSKETACAGT